MVQLEFLLIFAFVLGFASFQTTAANGVCYSSSSYYQRRGYTTHRSETYGYIYRCGWKGWRRCRGTRSRTVYYTAYYSEIRYHRNHFCCSGYYGNPYDCRERTKISRNPTDVVAEITSNVRFHVQARGYGTYTYQWYHNDSQLANQTDDYLYINNIALDDLGTYHCHVCNQDGYCDTSTRAILTVTVNAPNVLMHPVSQTINLVTNNVNMSLSCEADGHNLQYAWERLNNTLPNNTRSANTTTLYFTFLRPDDAGKYRCRVFNDSGYGYSDYGVLQIHVPPPQIIVQPQNTTAAEPFGAHFTCSANGYGEIKVDWYKANVLENLPSKVTISEERSSEKVTSILFIPHVVLEDEGGYFCMAKIGKVSTKSNIAYLEEIMSPMVTVEMDNTTVNLLVKNYNLSMECLPSDTDLDYQWHRKNSSLPPSAIGGNTPIMTIYRLTPEDGGEYQCLLSNASGTIASEFVKLKIDVPPPELLISPENISVSAYSEVKLSCTGRGFGDVKAAWTKPPSKLTTTAQYATERYDDRIVSTLTIPHALEIYSGSYCCAIINHVGSSDVQCADLQVKIPCPEISLSPSQSVILFDESVTFTCQAFSFGSIHYQWERDNNQIPSKAVTDVCSTTLTIPSGTQFDEGFYCCSATNDCGTVKECAMLSVIATPVITLQPKGTTVHVGTAMVVMSCSAVGHGAIKYQWERYLVDTTEWTTLPTGQQSDIANISIYTIENLSKENDGVYRCGASNIDGISYSINTTINVYGPPSITSPTTEIEVVEGHELILTCSATNDIKSPYDADILWYGPQGELIEENNNIDLSAIKIENVLTSAVKFKSVNHTLTGVSKCKSFNHPMSSNEFNFTITVDYAPRVYVSPSSPFTIKPGPKFLLHCSAEGRPSPTLQWYKNGQPYTTATTLSVQQIFVPRNSPSDSALYQCVAVNQIGDEIKSNNASIDFKVSVPTEGPCAANNGGCDHICSDESGIVQCFCEPGYFSIAFLPTKCFEVDECLYKLDKCEATCINTPGSYKCSCPYGQVLASDGYDCIECANDKSEINYTAIQSPQFISADKSVWHVAICGTNSTTCSGSLINNNFVITSASCVCDDELVFLQSVMVTFNKERGCDTQEIGSTDYSVTQIICHPMYNVTTLAYNVALLKLDRNVNTNIFKPVCLPTDRDQSTTSINRYTGVYGYENFDYVGSSTSFSDVIVPDITEELFIQVTEIVSNNKCSTAYGHIVLVDNKMMCTSSGNYTNCWGKSGSPVVITSEVDDHVILAGIASYRERKEGGMCSSNVPYGIHTKMDGLQQWIGDHFIA